MKNKTTTPGEKDFYITGTYKTGTKFVISFDCRADMEKWVDKNNDKIKEATGVGKVWLDFLNVYNE